MMVKVAVVVMVLIPSVLGRIYIILLIILPFYTTSETYTGIRIVSTLPINLLALPNVNKTV